jgi:glutamyl/glutaminyl-tRNA synthetase
VSRNPAIFNYEKLEWMNGEYFRSLSLARRAELTREHLRGTGAVSEAALADTAYLERAVAAVGDRMKRPQQFLEYAGYLFVPQVTPEPGPWAELKARPQAAPRLRLLADLVARTSPFEHDALDQAARALATAEGIKFGDLVMPARIALTGKKVSPGIWDVMLLLGRDRTVERLHDAASRLEAGAAVP